jgi:alpha-galactosidase
MSTKFRTSVVEGLCALSICLPIKLWGADIKIEIGRNGASPRVRYVSGGVYYVEQLVNGHWVDRDLGVYPGGTGHAWDGDAFKIQVKTSPTDKTKGKELNAWSFVSASQDPGTHPDWREAVVELASTQAPITVTVHTKLDGTAVLTRWLEIKNAGHAPIALTGLSVWSGRLWSGDTSMSVGYSTKWEVFWEGWFGWKRLENGQNILRQEHGLSFDHPYFLLHNEGRHEYIFGELAWPLNRIFEFDKENGLTFSAGPTATNALRVVAPGETVITPALHLGLTKGDFDTAVQSMHDHIRRSVLYARAPDRSYRIECTFPEDQRMSVYRGVDYNEANIKRFLDVISQLGIELFVMDGPTWASTFGEWLSPQKVEFPRGLQPLVSYAHEHHILFGLYVEPEGGIDGYTINHGLTIGPWENSELFREHPDWFIDWKNNANSDVRFVSKSGFTPTGVKPGQIPPVLNLTNPQAASYFTTELEKIVSHYSLDLYRHDFNTPLIGEGSATMRSGFLESDYWRHYEALYRAFDRLHAQFPDLILQQASAGGSRLDIGTLAHFSENYTSDRVSMPYVYRMLSGMSTYLPPETLVTGIGMASPKELPDLDTMLRSIYALGNTPVIFNSLVPRTADQLTPEIREKFLHYSRLYKTFIRPVLSSIRVYHHAPVNGSGGVESGNWFAMEFTSPDQSKGWAVIIRLDQSGGTYTFKARGLDTKKQYRVLFDSTGKATSIPGASLARSGLKIKPTGNTVSELLLFTVQ